jgi:hypothetical protein
VSPESDKETIRERLGRFGPQCRKYRGSREEEHALMSERDLALQARIRLASAAYHSLTLLSNEHLTPWDRANFSG